MLPADNPFARPSDLPFGLPPFDRISDEHLRPAFDAGMTEQRAEWEAVATHDAAPTVENTLEALERSGALLGRVAAVLFNLAASHARPPIRAVEEEVAPRLAEHSDALYLDHRLFARVDDLHGRRHELDLDAETARLLRRYHLDFVRAGAGLGADAQERLRHVNSELSALTTRFHSLVLDGANAAAVHIGDRVELDGLSPEQVAAAEQAARTRGHAQGWLLTLVLPTSQPALAVLTNRSVRQRLHEASVRRGLGGDHDTRPVLTRLVALRAERAELLGYPEHASWTVTDQTAGSVAAVDAMLTPMIGPAIANARAEAGELEAALRADGLDGPLQPWDWPFYADRVRRERFAVDASALRPYFELDRVLRDGVLNAASRLYGVSFTERHDLPTYHPDVRVFEVRDSDGSPLGLFLADWFARETKSGGAWMSTYADQSHLLGHRPVVTVNLNVPRPADGEPALLTGDEVRTAFHEFGHALHGLFSDVRYPRFSGTSVPRDFVEFPSQVNEMWAWDPDVLRAYAVHHATGEPLAPERIDAMLAARASGEGFATTEYLAAALLDLAWHRRTTAAGPVRPGDVEDVERDVLAVLGLTLDAVPPRYRTTYFAHVFAGGYSAGYYSYIWSEVLDADMVGWFAENGGLRRENGDAFRAGLLSRGGAVDPMEAFAAVRGRAPRIEPLLARRGLLADDAAAPAGRAAEPTGTGVS